MTPSALARRYRAAFKSLDIPAFGVGEAISLPTLGIWVELTSSCPGYLRVGMLLDVAMPSETHKPLLQHALNAANLACRGTVLATDPEGSVVFAYAQALTAPDGQLPELQHLVDVLPICIESVSAAARQWAQLGEDRNHLSQRRTPDSPAKATGGAERTLRDRYTRALSSCGWIVNVVRDGAIEFHDKPDLTFQVRIDPSVPHLLRIAVPFSDTIDDSAVAAAQTVNRGRHLAKVLLTAPRMERAAPSGVVTFLAEQPVSRLDCLPESRFLGDILPRLVRSIRRAVLAYGQSRLGVDPRGLQRHPYA